MIEVTLCYFNGDTESAPVGYAHPPARLSVERGGVVREFWLDQESIATGEALYREVASLRD